MAFYKNDGGYLLEAPNFVYSKEYTLLAEDKDNYQLPIDDWYWFNSGEEAKKFFNIME